MKKLITTSILLLGSIFTFAQSQLTFKAMLANTESKAIRKDAILAEPVLLSSPTPSNVSHFIISFKTGKDVLIGPFEIEGNSFSGNEKAMNAAKGLKKGDMIFVDDIKVTSAKEYKASSLVYVVE